MSIHRNLVKQIMMPLVRDHDASEQENSARLQEGQKMFFIHWTTDLPVSVLNEKNQVAEQCS